MVDKQGRLINESGYLVDENGHIVDKRGRMRMHSKILGPHGNMPTMFNYKGRKYDIRDVMGDLEKDRNGNAIIRRDSKNQMVDR